MMDPTLRFADDTLAWLEHLCQVVASVLLDHPWAVGIVLFVVLTVIVVDTARQESDEEKAVRAEAERVRQEVWRR